MPCLFPGTKGALTVWGHPNTRSLAGPGEWENTMQHTYIFQVFIIYLKINLWILVSWFFVNFLNLAGLTSVSPGLELRLVSGTLLLQTSALQSLAWEVWGAKGGLGEGSVQGLGLRQLTPRPAALYNHRAVPGSEEPCLGVRRPQLSPTVRCSYLHSVRLPSHRGN